MDQVGTVPEQLGNSPGMDEEQSRNGKEVVQAIPCEQICDHPEALLQSSEMIAVGEFDSISCNQFMMRILTTSAPDSHKLRRPILTKLRRPFSLNFGRGLLTRFGRGKFTFQKLKN